MNVGLYSGVAGMKAGADYQQLLAENLSLQAVPGYREAVPVFTTDLQVGPKNSTTISAGNPAAVRMTRVIDFTQGPVAPSGSPYHVAIQGSSFFEVSDPNGTQSYTRNGEFTLSPEGQLQTSDGASVLGSGGSALTIDTSKSSNVTIGGDGTISVGGVVQGKLELTHFDSPSTSLQPSAFGRFVASNGGDAQSGLAPGDKVLQGYLEQSNGNSVLQMVSMISAMRVYEANQKSIQSSDDSTAKLVSNLGSHPTA